ncbi:hypothetical protein ElyMa_006469800 [Elysia marginata]|uniref:Uncharacterized protein n=1 Tax=Elysia marginata TaxID=1093978 RepID=A0AAV4I1P5_9GAST|nr:hypothetical protein ElyMa_006469800 [Elysia marginata]
MRWREFVAALVTNSKKGRKRAIENIIVQKRWRWIGHVLRKDQNAIPRVAVQWKPEGRRKHGRPKITWRGTVQTRGAQETWTPQDHLEKDSESRGRNHGTVMGQSWDTLRTLARDRVRWRVFVAALGANSKRGRK